MLVCGQSWSNLSALRNSWKQPDSLMESRRQANMHHWSLGMSVNKRTNSTGICLVLSHDQSTQMLKAVNKHLADTSVVAKLTIHHFWGGQTNASHTVVHPDIYLLFFYVELFSGSKHPKSVLFHCGTVFAEWVIAHGSTLPTEVITLHTPKFPMNLVPYNNVHSKLYGAIRSIAD